MGRAAPRAAADGRLAGQLQLAKVPERFVRQHGPALENAIAAAGALAELENRLEPWLARAYRRTLDQTYASLARALDGVDAKSRPALAEGFLNEVRALVERIGPSEAAVSALNAAAGLLDLDARLRAQRKLQQSTEQIVAAAVDSPRRVGALHDQLSARYGVDRALNLFPTALEQLARVGNKLDDPQHRALLDRLTTFFVEVGPKSGFEDDTPARLARSLSEASAPGKPAEAVLADAAQRFHADFEGPRNEVKLQLDEVVPQPPAGGDARQRFDGLNEALTRVWDAHPAGPEPLYRALVDVRARAQAMLRNGLPQGQGIDPWPAMTTLVDTLGPTPLGLPFLSWATTTAQYFHGNALATQALGRAVAAEDRFQLAKALVDVSLSAIVRKPLAQFPEVEKEVDRLEKLGGDQALRVCLALGPHLQQLSAQPDLLRGVVDFILASTSHDLPGQLQGLVPRLVAFAQNLARYNYPDDWPARRYALAAALTRASANCANYADATQTSSAAVANLEQNLPGACDATLVDDDASGRGGLWRLVDPSIRYRTQPQYFLQQLANALNRAGVRNAPIEARRSAARSAVHLAAVIGNLDGNYQLPLQRIHADFEAAFREPAKLRYAAAAQGAVALRAQQQESVEAFLDAHPDLPPELALTAGLHLTPEQLAWVVSTAKGAKARDTKRSLRDFIFACVTANRLDLVQAVVESKSPPKAITRTIKHVGTAYREGQVAQLPFDQITQGLAAGNDPVAELEQAKVKESLRLLGLENLPLAETDPEGMAEIARCAEPITYLMEYFQPGKNYDGMDHGRFKEPLFKVVDSVARGTWPAPKYEDEHAKRQLAILSPEQQALWRRELVVTEADAAHDGGRFQTALDDLRGLSRLAREQIKLALPGLKAIAWDRESLERVEERYYSQVEGIRKVEKGSAEHRDLGAELGRTRSVLALLRLVVTFDEAQGDARSVLLKMKGLLPSAASAFREVGLTQAARAVGEVEFAARSIKATPKQGTYACDEDGLEALLTSTTGGCIHYKNVRRWANASLAANANEKILRVYEDGKFAARAIFKFYQADLGDYQGPVLWVNYPFQSGGGALQGEHLKLMTKHALLKAQSMGIPLVSAYADLTAGAQALGLEMQVKNGVKIHIDGGHTGADYADYLWGSDITTGKADKPFFVAQLRNQAKVVMPKAP